MKKNLLLKIRENLKKICLNDSMEIITYNELSEIEKKEYVKIWDEMIDSYKRNPNNEFYFYISETYPGSNLLKLLTMDGVRFTNGDNRIIYSVSNSVVMYYSSMREYVMKKRY